MEKFSWESSCMDEEEYEFLEKDEELGLSLSNWEIIDFSDADSEMHFSMEEDPVEQHLQKEDQEQDDLGNNGTTSCISLISKRITCVDELGKTHHRLDLIQGLDLKYHDKSYANYDENDVDDDGYDLDDELVPWSVSDKIGRQRMRKLGKRTFSKMYNSKRSPFLYVRPGCVRGKHGLGLKHNC